MPAPPDIVLWGVTRAGRRFRPSDWAERLAGLTAAFGLSERLAYSPLVRPMTIGGVRAVAVGGALRELEPRLYSFLLGFARDNDLQTSEVPDSIALPQALTPPTTAGSGGEPREPI